MIHIYIHISNMIDHDGYGFADAPDFVERGKAILEEALADTVKVLSSNVVVTQVCMYMCTCVRVYVCMCICNVCVHVYVCTCVCI